MRGIILDILGKKCGILLWRGDYGKATGTPILLAVLVMRKSCQGKLSYLSEKLR
jgi:hypothetical protein